MLSKREQDKMQRIFQSIDQNRDGELSYQEIFMGLQRIGWSDNQARLQADRIFKQIDLDNNGSIDYNEWCRATMNKNKILSQERLRAAYTFLDKDSNGKVDFAEIRGMFSQGGFDFSDQTFSQFV